MPVMLAAGVHAPNRQTAADRAIDVFGWTSRAGQLWCRTHSTQDSEVS